MRKFAIVPLVMILLLAVLPPVMAQDGGDDENTPPEEPQPGTFLGILTIDEYVRGYLMHIPPGYDGDTALPLVLSYHGFTADPIQNEQRTGLSALADEHNFIVVYPAGQREPMGWYTQHDPLENGWLDDVHFTRELIADLQSRLNIDPRRIYATGFSNGGGMAHRVGCELSDTIAAVASVAGPQFTGEPCEITRPVPMLGIYGKNDRNAPYDGYYHVLQPVPDWAAEWGERNQCAEETELDIVDESGELTVEYWLDCTADGDVVLYLYENGGHTWPEGTAARVWNFFEAHPMPE